MKTVDQFNDYCVREMASDLAILEKIRRIAQIKVLSMTAIICCAGVILVDWALRQKAGGEADGEAKWKGLILLFLIAFSAYFALMKFFTREYHAAYKMSVMDKLVRFLDPTLQYDPFGFVQGDVYSSANLFNRQADCYSGSDLVRGRFGDIPVEFSQVHSEYCTKRKRQNKGTTIFKGLFFAADLKKEFSGQTMVLHDVAENLLGKFGQKLQSLMPPVGQLVKFDDAEFEKNFAVYSENEIQARDIFSYALMYKLVEFRKKNRLDLRLSFRGSHVFVAISFGRSPCMPPLFGPIISFCRLSQYLDCVSFAMDVVKELNSDNRKFPSKEIPIGHGATALL